MVTLDTQHAIIYPFHRSVKLEFSVRRPSGGAVLAVVTHGAPANTFCRGGAYVDGRKNNR